MSIWEQPKGKQNMAVINCFLLAIFMGLHSKYLSLRYLSPSSIKYAKFLIKKGQPSYFQFHITYIEHIWK